MQIMRRDFLALAGTAIASLAAPTAWAQTYPARPVRMIVPFAPGGGVDVVGRLIAQKLSERLGQQFYIENIGGGGSTIGTARAARTAPDGYTILFTAPAFVINALRDKIPYDPRSDFAPVTSPVTTTLVLTVNPSVPAHTVKDLAALIQASPTKYSYSSPGIGTPPHLVGELFRLSLGLDIAHVPYNSAGPSIASVVAGHTPVSFAAVASAVAQVKEGNLRALAVAGRARSPVLPDVPTMAEAGYPGIEGEVWCGVLAPAGTPKEIVALLHREIVAIIKRPDVKQRLAAIDFTLVGNTPDQFANQIKAELAKWAKVVREAGIKAK
jgi:tripartite-type tricarboxylate transporter receptor subunit TctC